MPDNLMASTSLVGKILNAVTLTTSAANVYAAPTSTGAIIRKCLAHNSSVNPVGVTVAISMAGAAAVQTQIFNVPPGDTADLEELAGLALGPLDAVAMTATAASAINVVISGTVNS